jgi:hypothetical protein
VLRPPHHLRGTQPVGAGQGERRLQGKTEAVGAGALHLFGPDGETEHAAASRWREAPKTRGRRRTNLRSCFHCFHLGTRSKRRGRTRLQYKQHRPDEAPKRASLHSTPPTRLHGRPGKRSHKKHRCAAPLPCHHDWTREVAQPQICTSKAGSYDPLYTGRR